MANRLTLFVGVTLALAGAGCSGMSEEAAKPNVTVASGVNEGADRVERSHTVRVTAIVEAVDLQNRRVTLHLPEGKTTTVTVSDAVRNLPQLHKGDSVNVEYYESLAIQIRKPGEATVGDVAVAEGAERAKLGDTPGAAGARAVTVIASVEAIDKANGTVTLKGPGGENETIKARNPANLDKIKVGDTLEITYTQAVAIAVEKP